MTKLDHMQTDEDCDIRLNFAINQQAKPWLATLRADDNDAAIMRRLLKTRKNNKRARAFAEQPGELA